MLYMVEQSHTARKKLVRIRRIESCQPISLVEFKLLVNYCVIILVQLLILSNFLPHAVAVIVIRDRIFMTFSPQEVLQNEDRVKLKTQLAIQPDRISGSKIQRLDKQISIHMQKFSTQTISMNLYHKSGFLHRMSSYINTVLIHIKA